MAWIYVAQSKDLSAWGDGVGLTKHLFLVDVTEGTVDDAIAGLNAAKHAGRADWKMVKRVKVDDLTREDALERLAKKEQRVDPNYYPAIRDARDIFKIKPGNVSNHLMVQSALKGELLKSDKIKPTDIAGYLIENAKPATTAEGDGEA